MGEVFGERSVRSARKEHACWWCGEKIDRGTPYKSWLWKEGGEVGRVCVHPECLEAWYCLDHIDRNDVGYAGFSRGCTCENGGCECVSAERNEA